MPTNLDPDESYIHVDLAHATSSSATVSDLTLTSADFATTAASIAFPHQTYRSTISIDYSIYLEAALRESIHKCSSAKDHKKLILHITDIYNEVLGHDCVNGDYVEFEFDEDEFNKILGDE